MFNHIKSLQIKYPGSFRLFIRCGFIFAITFVVIITLHSTLEVFKGISKMDLISDMADLGNIYSLVKKRITKSDVATTSTPQWYPDEFGIASTTDRRTKAMKKLKLDKGEYYLAYFSINCGECDEEAKALNIKAENSKVVAITVAEKSLAQNWKQQLDLKYPVIAVDEKVFDDLGAVLLPMLVWVKDGKVLGVSQTAQTIK